MIAESKSKKQKRIIDELTAKLDNNLPIELAEEERLVLYDKFSSRARKVVNFPAIKSKSFEEFKIKMDSLLMEAQRFAENLIDKCYQISGEHSYYYNNSYNNVKKIVASGYKYRTDEDLISTLKKHIKNEREREEKIRLEKEKNRELIKKQREKQREKQNAIPKKMKSEIDRLKKEIDRLKKIK